MEHETSLHELIEMLEEKMKQLSEQCRDLIYKYYYEQWQDKSLAMAGITNYTSADSVKANRYKCLRQLEKLMKEENIKT